MFLSTIVLYFYVRNLLQGEIEEELRSTEARVESALRKDQTIYSLPPIVEIEVVSEMGTEMLKDTIIFDPSQNEMEDFRELTSFADIGGKNYRITVRNLIVESEDILIAVVFSYLVIIVLVFIFLFYFNKTRNQQLWRPFFTNLEQMKRFSLISESPIALVDSDILEFTELNSEITTLTEKVRLDYKNLKQFTEDVSHEIQTPLAIIQAKIENIINDNTINEGQFNQITSIQSDIQRLTQLNKKLALLSKIGNNQFDNAETVNITDLVLGGIENLKELSMAKIDFSVQEKIEVKMDPHLAEILCTNLISNAIKHNRGENGIQILAKDKTLSLLNYGKEPLKQPDRIFNRFYRETNENKSLGLGLAIVKKICDLYGFGITYAFKNRQHVFTLEFK